MTSIPGPEDAASARTWLSEFAVGAGATPSWTDAVAPRPTATMLFWCGRPLLALPDPVAVAVGLHWIAEAWLACGLPTHGDDGQAGLVASLDQVGPVSGAADDWLLRWLYVLVMEELERYRDPTTVLLVPPEHAAYELAQGLGRGLQVMASTPTQAYFMLMRARAGLTTAASGDRIGWTARQWEHAERARVRDIDPGLVPALGEAFGASDARLKSVRDAVPIPVATGPEGCPHHPTTGTLAPTDDALWQLGGSRPPAWLPEAGGGFVVRCSVSGCDRTYALSSGCQYLRPPSGDLPPSLLAQYVE